MLVVSSAYKQHRGHNFPSFSPIGKTLCAACLFLIDEDAYMGALMAMKM
jgi:hypothetical protein